MVLVIRGRRYWLWRAVDNEGEVLDFLVQSRRNAKAAKKLMKKLLKKQGFAPSRVVTDKLRSYPPAFRDLALTAEHLHSQWANNRAENSHQPVRRREQKLQRVLSNQCEPVSKWQNFATFRPPADATQPKLRSGSL
jgi:transposase-like protein